MKKGIIFAGNSELAIGQSTAEKGLPWKDISEDFKHFQRITKGYGRVLMGRKTWEIIFKLLGKPLPGRENIVISKTIIKPPYPGVLVFNSFELAMEYLDDKDAICIGGAEVYKQFIPYAQELFFTHVHGVHEDADCFIDRSIFNGFIEIPSEMILLRKKSADETKVTAHYYKREHT